MSTRPDPLSRLILGAVLFLVLGLLTLVPAPPASPAGPLVAAAAPTNLLKNPGFESGNFDFWTTSGSPKVLSLVRHSGSYSARVAGRDNAEDAIWQDITLPYAVSRIQVDFYYHISTDEDGGGQDYLTVLIDCPAGHNVASWNLAARHDVAWTLGSVDSAQLYGAGLVCRLKASGTTDDSLPGTFYLDDLLLSLTEADETPTPPLTNTPTATRTATRTVTLPPSTPTHTGVATLTRTPTTTPPGWQPKRAFLPLVVRGYWQLRPEDCSELLTNGGFESVGLSSWSFAGDVVLGVGRTGGSGAQLGGRNNAQGELGQTVYVPAGAATVTWEFWWKAEVASPQPDDYLRIYAESQGLVTPLAFLRAEAPLNEWRHLVLDLSPWAGQWVTAAFQVVTDGSVPSTFRIDDASVQSCVR